jgi:hypothetical protein
MNCGLLDHLMKFQKFQKIHYQEKTPLLVVVAQLQVESPHQGNCLEFHHHQHLQKLLQDDGIN